MLANSFVRACSRVNALPVIVLAVCCLLACVRITGRPVIKDASETLTMALNLAHHGVMSLDEQPPLHPSMARDPLPVWTTAAAVRIEDLLAGAASPGSYFQGPRAQGLKLQNVIWLAMLMTSAAIAAGRLASPVSTRRLRWIYQLAGGLLVALPFTVWIPHGAEYAIGMDSLDTELLGAMWLLLGALLLTLAWTNGRLWWLLGASTVFGLMALTKAAVFYVYPAVLVLIGGGASVHPCRAAMAAAQCPDCRGGTGTISCCSAAAGCFATCSRRDCSPLESGVVPCCYTGDFSTPCPGKNFADLSTPGVRGHYTALWAS